MKTLIDWFIGQGLPNGKEAEWVSAIFTFAQAGFALLILIVGYFQLKAIRKQIEASTEQTKQLAEQTQHIAQQRKIEDEREKRRVTLQAIDRYDLDPILHQCLIAIRQKTNKPESNQKSGAQRGPAKGSLSIIKPEIATLLNYLDGLAIGIKQGVYDERMIKDHMKAIICKHVDELLSDAYVKAVGIERSNYEMVLHLKENWSKKTVDTDYKVDEN